MIDANLDEESARSGFLSVRFVVVFISSIDVESLFLLH